MYIYIYIYYLLYTYVYISSPRGNPPASERAYLLELVMVKDVCLLAVLASSSTRLS